MKKTLFFLIILILFLAFVVYNNTDPRAIISELAKKGDIRQGDLRYRINLFGIIPIGEATLSLERQIEYKGSKVYHLNATAAPLKYYAKFFKGYAVLDSYVDSDTLNPVLFKQKVEAPGKENPYKEVSYDQKNGTMSLEGVKRSIFPNTQDPLSALFNIRRMDLDNTKKIEISINTNQKNYILAGSAETGDLTINKKIYKIALLNTQIKRRDKDSYHKSKVWMVLLRGKENIPISIKVFASGILINVKLVDISH
jgi:Protein of unknown function (DUF3108)